MELLFSVVVAVGLVYALGREHGARVARRTKAPNKSEWSPFDEFWSDRR